MSRRTQSVGKMRMEQAELHGISEIYRFSESLRETKRELGRDMKRERAMCAFGGCTASHNLKKGPKGYTGRYGGVHVVAKLPRFTESFRETKREDHLCPSCYQTVLARLNKSLDEHGCAPWELDD